MKEPPKYLSATQINLYRKSPGQYYSQYFVGVKIPSTPAMRLGSAFDYYVKCELADYGAYNARAHQAKLGDLTPSDLTIGKEVFENYRACGALTSLCSEIPPGAALAMEEDFTVSIFGVPIRGLPDIYWTKDGRLRVNDWKVSGYYSVNGVRIKKGFEFAWAKSGIRYTGEWKPLPQINDEWALQLTLYAWVVGKQVLKLSDDDLLTFAVDLGIDQLAHRPGGLFDVLCYRWAPGTEYRTLLKDLIIKMWADVSAGMPAYAPTTPPLIAGLTTAPDLSGGCVTGPRVGTPGEVRPLGLQLIDLKALGLDKQ